MLFKKLKAVSYVEIVVVLMVIGTVSAMAIPSMKRYSQRHELGVLAQNAYYTLNDALDNSIINYGPSRKWSCDNNTFSTFIKPSIQTLSSGSNYTKSGMYINPLPCSGSVVSVGIDVNGLNKGPNLMGKDIHYFEIDLKAAKVSPRANTNTEELYKNSWRFTDALWNK